MRKSALFLVCLTGMACVSFGADASRDGLANPERGFRFEIPVGLETGERPWGRDRWPFARYAKDGIVIAQSYCYLTKYCASDIPPSKLAALQADFDRARTAGVKFLLRFAYERDTSRKTGPTLERILSHIGQLKGIVNRNADVIYALQIGWVGAWGEFHSSYSGVENNPDQVAQVVRKTLEILPPNRKTMMRTMLQREKALAVMGDADADRIGFFNDATLSNVPESGTFVGDPEKNAKLAWDTLLWSKYAEPGNVHYDLVRQLGRRAPVDGELFWTDSHVFPVRESGLAAIFRLHDHHYTTFSVVHGNSELDSPDEPGSIDRWKRTPVTAEHLRDYGIDVDPAYFEGVPYRTAYEFIRDHLGYRLVAKSCVRKGDKVSLTLHNYGFAPPVNPREAYFTVVAQDGSFKDYPTGFDCRALTDGADTVISCAVPPLGAGERLSLWVPDEMMKDRAAYAIRLAGGAEVAVCGGRLLNFLQN